MKVFFSGLFFFLIPLLSHAAVRINEVAWMGTVNSANDEWIELYNDTDTSVTIDGWKLSDGANLNIALSGTLPAYTYSVLERTDDDSAPGTALVIYSGALPNTGALLSLYRDDGVLEDQVVGGDNWENIGGDNQTKQTAQYTQQGWITADATPGKINTTTHTTPNDDNAEDNGDNGDNGGDDDANNQTKSKKSHSSTIGTLHLEQRDIQLFLNVPRQVYVDQAVTMTVDAEGVSEPIINSLEHVWNFGDFNTAKGSEVLHRFTYPGEYVVTLKSTYKDYQAQTRQSVTVLPVSFSIGYSSRGDVQVHNNAKYEVDISGYTIHTKDKKLRFPMGTIMLPNATITIPKDRLNYTNGAYIILKDEMSTIVATEGSFISAPRRQVVEQPLVVRQQVSVSNGTHTQPKNPNESVHGTSVVSESSTFSFVTDAPKESTGSTKVVELPDTQTQEASNTLPIPNTLQAAPIQAVPTIPKEKLAYFALLAVIGLGVLAVFAGKSNTESE